MKLFIRHLIEILYSVAVTYMIGRWGVNMAYLERGYKALGGELLLIPIAYLIAWGAIHYFIDALEETANEMFIQEKEK